MKQLVTYALIAIMAGLLVWVYANRTPPKIIVSEASNEAAEAKARATIDSVKNRAQKLRHKLTTDSLRRSQQNKQQARLITNLEAQIRALKESLGDSTLSNEQVILKQDSVIGLQDIEIRELKDRVFDDSLHIAAIHANFEQRIAFCIQENEQLKQIVSIRDDTISIRDQEISKQKKRSTIKSVLIIALALARVLI